MDRVWITNGSTSIPPVVNPLIAACHDGYVPTDVYVLNNPITDDLRALPELQHVADATAAISPLVLKALVKRDVLEQEEVVRKLDERAEQRDWLGAPIYRRAKNLFE